MAEKAGDDDFSDVGSVRTPADHHRHHNPISSFTILYTYIYVCVYTQRSREGISDNKGMSMWKRRRQWRDRNVK